MKADIREFIIARRTEAEREVRGNHQDGYWLSAERKRPTLSWPSMWRWIDGQILPGPGQGWPGRTKPGGAIKGCRPEQDNLG